MLTVTRHATIAAFRDAAGPWLMRREAEHNLVLGILGTAIETPAASGDLPPYLATVDDPRRGIVAAAIRTPPSRVVLSEVDDSAAIPIIAAALAAAAPDVTGIVGPAEHVGPFASGVAQRLGRYARRMLSERSFRLTRVLPPRPAPGAARLARPADRALVLAWYDAFEDEAIGAARGDAPPDPELAARLDRALAGEGSRRIWLWEDGEPVSLVGVGGPTPNGIRVGPVYTPPPFRRRGYASACVAAASQAALDAGRTFVFLVTDLANPTANHIYQAIGYEPVRDIDEWIIE